MKRDQFLSFVADYIRQDPEAAAYIAEAARRGVSAALSEANARAADMETALAVALARRYKGGADALIYDKLKKWDGRTSLNWSHVLPNAKSKPPAEGGSA